MLKFLHQLASRLDLAWRYWRDRKLHYSWRTAWILAEGRSPWLI